MDSGLFERVQWFKPDVETLRINLPARGVGETLTNSKINRLEPATKKGNAMNAKDVIKELKSLGSDATKNTLLRHGAREPVFGVKVADLKVIQKRVKKDYQLALDLYASGNFDAMYLAGLVADDKKMTKKQLQDWAKAAYGGWLSGFVVPWVAAESDHGWELGLKWIDSKDDLIASMGWGSIGALTSITPDDQLDLSALKKLLQRVQKEIHKTGNNTREAMNRFVISLGSNVASLKDFAINIGEKIGPVSIDHGDTACATPFSPDQIRKVEKRGAIGKKRKTTKC